MARSPLSASRPLRIARGLQLLAAVAAFLVSLATSRTANAYPWMIRHGYASCITCHADPSGSGLVTESSS